MSHGYHNEHIVHVVTRVKNECDAKMGHGEFKEHITTRVNDECDATISHGELTEHIDYPNGIIYIAPLPEVKDDPDEDKERKEEFSVNTVKLETDEQHNIVEPTNELVDSRDGEEMTELNSEGRKNTEEQGRSKKNGLTCTFCGRTYANKNTLNKHVRIHTLKKPHRCSGCGKMFSRKPELDGHMDECKRAHGNDVNVNDNKCDKPKRSELTCRFCGMTLLNKTNLNRHIRRLHTREKPYGCSVCGKMFSSKEDLNAHTKVHSAEQKANKSVACPECDKKCPSEAALRSHRRTHTGEKPFACSVCGKSFSQKCSVTWHLRTHTGEKPHECSFCGKRFSVQSSLNSHIKLLHSGPKNGPSPKLYACSICDKSFTQKQSLNIHSRIHSGEKPFLCSVCGKSFSVRSNFKVHLKTHE